MTILLTGACGFVGSHTAAALLRAGHWVIGLDNLANPSLEWEKRIRLAGEHFHLIHGDVNAKNPEYKNNGGMVDAIVHLAALGSVTRSFERPAETTGTNCAGFANILRLAKELRVKRVVFASSSSVYGDCPDPIKVEGKEGLPQSPYALSKVHNEHMARIWEDSTMIETIGLRFFNVYGPGQRPDSPYSAVIPRFCTDRELTIYGDGETVRDFTFVNDVASVILKSLTIEDHGFCVNVGTGQPTKIKDLALMLARGRPILHKAARSEARVSIASTEKLNSIFGVTRFTAISEGLTQTREFYDLHHTNQN